MTQYAKEFREQAILLSDERNCRTEGSKWNPKGCNEFFRKRPENIGACSKFEYVFQFKQKNFESQLKKDYSVKKLCKVLTVSETGFYKWKRNRNKPKAWQILLQKIYEILDEHPDNHNYGIDRIFAGFESKRWISFKIYCNSSHEDSQYTSLKYKIELGKMHAIQSMSDVGKCYDNCRMESFFATLKKEKLYQLDTMKMTMEEVKTEVWRFVQYYNRTRICTFNEGGYPPVVYRKKVAAGELKAAA